ncbi:MAG: class I SAM-dependent methyltransferase [Ignavibacteriae bacterium]|nr:class I SAM-dependent methyltransferase [Ignavibacteriota bacterium]
MDILNLLPPQRFRAVDDLLAFISIYDDKKRTRAYYKLLRAHKKHIYNSVCVEGGCGLDLFSVELARLGAKKVYAVEQNTLLAKLAQERINRLPAKIRNRIEIVNKPLQQFQPKESVDVLVHEFYGQLLYDEDLWVLERLRFKPRLVLPDGGKLWAGVVSSDFYKDRVVTQAVIRQLDGVLVSGLFQERFNELKAPVLQWKYGRGLRNLKHNFGKQNGDLLALGLRVTHAGKTVCEAGQCPNWSYVWTHRKGNEISLLFRKSSGMMDARFKWKG